MKNQKVLAIIAVVLFLLAIGYVVLYEFVLRERINREDVIVVTRNIEYNEIITAEDLTFVAIQRDRTTPDMIRDPNEILDKRAVSYIPQAAFLTESMLDSAELISEETERFVSIPNSWIESIPGSLRRLDDIDIWLVDNRTGEEVTKRSFSTGTPFLTNKKVAYVKNARNAEVVGTLSPDDRLDAESSLHELEIIASEEEIRLLKEAYESGYKLLMTYKDSRGK